MPPPCGIGRVCIDLGMVEARRPVVMVGKQVVMEGGVLAPPDTSITMGTLLMSGIAQALSQDAPLQGEVLILVERGTFIHRPAHGAMVQDDIIVATAPDGVLLCAVAFRILDGVAKAETDETDNDIGGLDVCRIIFQADTVSGSRLTGNGDIPLIDFQYRLKSDFTGNVENDGASSGLAERPSKRPFTGIIQIGHMIDLSAPAAGRVHAAALGAREGARDAIFFRSRDQQVLIGLGRLGTRTRRRIDGTLRARIDGTFSGDIALSAVIRRPQAAYAETVVGRLLQAVHLHVSGAHAPLFHFFTALVQSPLIARRVLHRIPLESQRSLGGCVQVHACRSSGIRRLFRLHGFGIPAGGDQRQRTRGHQDIRQSSHFISYSSAAQISGPIPFGSLLTTRSLM